MEEEDEVVERATLEEAIDSGISLEYNSFVVLHSWSAGPMLLAFAEQVRGPLAEKPMAAAELAAATGLNEGPLAIVLRTSSIFGYTSFNRSEGTYSLVTGPELDELDMHLGSSSEVTKALHKLYAEAHPPFKLTSQQAACCLEVWKTTRQSWEDSGSAKLRMILDGIVVAPLITSIVYNEHWDEEGNHVKEGNVPTHINLDGLDAQHKETMGSIAQQLEVGDLESGQGNLQMDLSGWECLSQAESFFKAMSHAPLLGQFQKLLTKDPATFGDDEGIQDALAANDEASPGKTLRMVGLSLVQAPLYEDMLRHMRHVFGGEDFAKQPKGVMDMRCGEAQLLVDIYSYIAEYMPRGDCFDAHPLLCIACDDDSETRVKAGIRLGKAEIPYAPVGKGDIGKPAETWAYMKKTSKRKKIPEADTILHVRAFRDHLRKFVPPEKPFADELNITRFAKEQMCDFVHLDKDWKPIKAADIFASLVEYFQRWSKAMEGAFGLCVLEEMMLDIPTSANFINDSLEFSASTIGALSREYRVSAGTFILAAAMNGLVPAKYDDVVNYPEKGLYTLVINQHLIQKPFRIRLAEMTDVDELVRLEEVGWAPDLRKSKEHLVRRLETSPTTTFVCELNDRIIAVMYVQKISNMDAIETYDKPHKAYDPDGRILQLLAIVADKAQDVTALAVGNELRNFVLHLARMDPAVDFVCGVTRCGDFRGRSPQEMIGYVNRHQSNEIMDPVLGFHTAYGASIVRCVLNYRPEDKANQGVGVLIRYDVKSWKAKEVDLKSQVRPVYYSSYKSEDSDRGEPEPQQPVGEQTGLDIIKGMMKNMGFPVDNDTLRTGWFGLGMDSLDLVRMRNRVSGVLGYELSTTLLLDHPNVFTLGNFLQQERRLQSQVSGDPGPGSSTTRSWQKMTEKEIANVIEKLHKFYSLPQYASRLDEIRRQGGGRDIVRQKIEAVRNQVEGPLFVANKILAASPGTTDIKKARQELEEWMDKHGNDHPRLRIRWNEVAELISF